MKNKKIILALLLLLPFTYKIDASRNNKSHDIKVVGNKNAYGFGEFENERRVDSDYLSTPSCSSSFVVTEVSRQSNKTITIRAWYGRNRDFTGKPSAYVDVKTGISGAHQFRINGENTYTDIYNRAYKFVIPINEHYSGRTTLGLNAIEGSCVNTVDIYHYTGRKHIYDNVEFTLSPLQRRDRVLDWQQSSDDAIVFDNNGRWNQRYKFKKHGSGYRIVSVSKPNYRLGTFHNEYVSVKNDNNCSENVYIWDIELKGYANINQTKIKLKNRKNGLYLDVPYSNYANRIQFTTYRHTNNPNQEFIINSFKYK